ncbi:MAG: methyl-accepting chemotaxis protein [Verrucomicrobiota bacterium]
MHLKKKLTLSILVTGLVPLLIVSLVAIRAVKHQAVDLEEGYQYIANAALDKIDRNLFERYGDVQAFAVNKAISDKGSWYKVGASGNQIADAANKYANLYGFYLLSYMVDLDGRVVAVNDLNPAGKTIDTNYLYKKNFKNADWFRDVMAGRFLKSESLDGTVVQDLHVDEDVKRIYNNDGLVLGFSASVKDSEGNVIGVWHNAANFSLVEEVLVDAYSHLKAHKQPESEITLIDSKGRVLVECDPFVKGGTEIKRDLNVVLKTNLVEHGSEVAKKLVNGESGFGEVVHTRKKIEQVVGFSASQGALGFPGLKWGLMVRLDKKVALAKLWAQIYQLAVICVLGAAGLVAVGLRISGKMASVLQGGVDALSNVTSALGDAGHTISDSSQEVAAGSNQQAASLEETSASLEEISAMANRSAENAVSGKKLSEQARASANQGMDRISEMSRTLETIRAAVKDMETSVGEIQDSNREVGKIIKTIDEIAFQTNLLALNAAVEAARAGEAGMGFAVVADEVRALAQRSANAAKETAEKIESAIKRSEQGGATSVRVVNSLGEVEHTARNLETVFGEIVAQISDLDGVIAEMTSASQEQSLGVSQVNNALTQLDKVTQSNASAAEANADSAAELTNQVATLEDVVMDLQMMVTGDVGAGSHTSRGAALSSSTRVQSSSREMLDTEVVRTRKIGGKRADNVRVTK